MGKFIKLKLSTTSDGRSIYIDSSKIITMEERSSWTIIRMLGGIKEEVYETPEEIIDKISK